MNVNEQAYGSKDLWYSIAYSSSAQFPASVPKEERNMLANFTDSIPSETYVTWPLYLGRVIYEIEVNDNQTLKDLFYNAIFDRSICFVGQSGKSSYTSIRFFDNQGTNSNNPNVNELPTQTYDVVNLAFSYGGSSARDYGNGVRKWDVIGADIDRDPSGNPLKFDAIRWNPLGWSGIRGTNYYYMDYGFRNNTTFVTNMGVKRNVLLPYVKAGTTDTSDTNAIRTYDLATYLSTYKDSKPYIYSIGFEVNVMYGESIEASSSNQRTFDSGYHLMLMDYISSLNDFYQISPNNNWQTAHYNNDLFVPRMLKSSHIPIGGYINNGSYENETPSTLGYESTLNSVGVHAVIDCNDIKWDTWVNIGSSTAEGTCNKILVADARNYTEEEFREAVRHSLACFGMFFTDSKTVAHQGKLDDPEMHLGTIVDGVGYGDYTSGPDNRDQPQWDWDSMSENDYDPDNPPTPSPFIPDPNGYNDGMSLSQLDGFETATQRYNLYKAQAHQVFAALWSVWDPFDESDPDLNTAQIDLKTKKMFLTNNPLDCVIGLKYFPVPADMIGTGSDTPVKLGALTLHQAGSSTVEIQCKMAQNSYIHDCGSVYCAPQYQDYSGISDSWIDQYVGFELYLPFCGSVKLDTATYIGKWVNVQYHIDYITGACTAYIGIPSAVNRSVSEFMEIRSGNCAIDVPISGIQQATLEANMFNATQQLKGAALKGVSSVVGNLISTAGKAAAKDIGGAVSAGFSTVGSIAGSVNEIQSAKFELQHTQLPARMIGSASALSGAEGYLSPMLIVTEPRLIEVPDNYGHTVGFACMRYGKLKDISSGYTEINSVDLDGIACTAEEKSIIRSVLAGGIYL